MPLAHGGQPWQDGIVFTATLAHYGGRELYLKVFRDRDCWYIAMLPAQGAVAPRAVNAPVYFVGDTMLPVTHVHGHLLAINADTRTIRWRRTVPLRSVVRFRHDHLPALILLGRTRDRGRGGRQRMLVELLDSKTGRTLLLEDKLSTDRIVPLLFDRPRRRPDRPVPCLAWCGSHQGRCGGVLPAARPEFCRLGLHP